MAKYSDGYITGRLIPEWFIQEVNDRGAAKPTLHIAPNGIGGGMSGMY